MAKLGINVGVDDKGFQEFQKSLADFIKFVESGIPGGFKKGFDDAANAAKSASQKTKQTFEDTASASAAAQAHIKAATEQRIHAEETAEKLKFEELKAEYKKQGKAVDDLMTAKKTAASKEAKAEIQIEMDKAKDLRKIYGKELDERPETKKGKASDVGKLGTQREVEGTGKGLLEVAGIGAAVEGFKMLTEQASEANKVMSALQASTGLDGKQLDETAESAKKLGDQYKIGGNAGIQAMAEVGSYTHAQGKELQQQTEDAIILAQKMGVSTDMAAKMLGKAADPEVAGNLAKLGIALDQNATADQRAAAIHQAAMKAKSGVDKANMDANTQMAFTLQKVQETVGNVAASVLNAFVPAIIAIQPLIDTLGKLLGDTLAPVLTALTPLITLIAKGLAALAPIIVDLVTGPITIFSDILSEVITTVTNGKVAFGILAVAIGVFAIAMNASTISTGIWSTVTGVASGVMTAFNAVMATNPITLVAIAVAGFAAGMIYLYQNVKPVRDLLDKVWAVIKAGGEAIGAFVSNYIHSLIAAFQAVGKILTSLIHLDFSGVADGAAELGKSIGDAYVGGAKKAMAAAGDSMADSAVKKQWDDAKDSAAKNLKDLDTKLADPNLTEGQRASLQKQREQWADYSKKVGNDTLAQTKADGAAQAQQTADFGKADLNHLRSAIMAKRLTEQDEAAFRAKATAAGNQTALDMLDKWDQQKAKQGASAAKKEAKDKTQAAVEAANGELSAFKDGLAALDITDREAKKRTIVAEIDNATKIQQIMLDAYGEQSKQYIAAHNKLLTLQKSQRQDDIANQVQDIHDATDKMLAELAIRADKENLSAKQVSELTYNTKLDALNKELALYKEGTKEYSALMMQRTSMTAAHGAQERKDALATAQEVAKLKLDNEKTALQQQQELGTIGVDEQGKLHNLAVEQENEQYAEELAKRKEQGQKLQDVTGGLTALGEQLEAQHQAKLNAIDNADRKQNIADAQAFFTQTLTLMQGSWGDREKALKQFLLQEAQQYAMQWVAQTAATEIGEAKKTALVVEGFISREATYAAEAVASAASAVGTWIATAAKAVYNAFEILPFPLDIVAAAGAVAAVYEIEQKVQSMFTPKKYAFGTDNHPGGLAYVGDAGPELINMPPGSRVIPNNRINQFQQNDMTPLLNAVQGLHGAIAGTTNAVTNKPNGVLYSPYDVTKQKANMAQRSTNVRKLGK